MAKVDDPKMPGWDEPPSAPQAGRGSVASEPYFSQLSLVAHHDLVVYFAILFWCFKQIIETNGYPAWIAFGVLVGLGLCGVGLWAVVEAVPLRVHRLDLLRHRLHDDHRCVTTYGLAIPYAADPDRRDHLPELPAALEQPGRLALGARSGGRPRGCPWLPGSRRSRARSPGCIRSGRRRWPTFSGEACRARCPRQPAQARPEAICPPDPDGLGVGRPGPRACKRPVASRETRQPLLQAIGGRMAYLGWVATIGTFIVGFVLYFIIPKFEAIFRDFGSMLPEVTILVIRASHFLVDYSLARRPGDCSRP